MKIRFNIDQAEAFRRGVDAPMSLVTIDVDPAALTEADRNLIADRLWEGIDVCRIEIKQDGKRGPSTGYNQANTAPVPLRVGAPLPTFEALMEAVRKDEQLLATEAVERVARVAALGAHFRL